VLLLFWTAAGPAPARARRPVRVGLFDFMPCIFQDGQGQPQGLFVDMLREVAAREAWDLTFVPGTWTQGLERLRRGEVDLVTSVARTSGRESYLTFGKVPAFTVWSNLYARSSAGITSILDLQSRRIALMRNDINGQHLKELCRNFAIPFVEVPVDSMPQVLAAVAEGRADAGVVGNLFGYANEHAYPVTRTPVVFSPFDIYFATGRDSNPDLLAALDGYLREGRASANSHYNRVVDHWLRPGERPGVPNWVVYVAGASLGALVLALAAIGVFRHQVNRATAKIRALNAHLHKELDQRERSEARRLELERQVQHVQKLESLGMLAGGIAHDFNNLLTAMLGHIDVAGSRLGSGDPARPHLESLERIIHRAADLTRQMLAYSGRGRFVVRRQDFNQVIRDVTHLLQVSMSKKVRLDFDLAEPLPTVQADAAQVQQVVMNLVTNAADAIGDREGTIRITTRAADLDRTDLDRAFQGRGLAPGRYVAVEVDDTGCGMTPEVRARIFDPFFTTKPTGHGLGLAATLGILKGHGAAVEIHSEPGRGTRFRLLFPADPGGVAETRPAEPAGGELPPATVLLVDDERMILDSTRAGLEALGLSVVTAGDGLEALDRLQEPGAKVDLVIMDLTMPRMDGHEAYARIRALRPGLPVILSSGYNEQESVRRLPDAGLAGFLQKPYTLKALAGAVGAALAGTGI
jgi:signal transduction histidine kinase/CheY-like chemotaxis protein